MTALPTKVWTKLSGSFSGDIAHAITVGLDGSIYVSGLASGVLDGQTSSGAEDAFLTKYSADGTKVWTKLIGTTARDFANALATGLDGSIYVAGVTNGSLDGLTNSGGEDAFVSKFKPDGTKVWTKLLGGSRSDAALGITIGLDGSIFITGQTENALDGQTNRGGLDAFLTKYSTDGTKVWTKLLGTSGWDVGNALSTGKDGSVYIAGYTYGSLDGQAHSGGEDAFLTKFNADGSKVWTKVLGSSSADIAYALTPGLDGSIYVSGLTGAIAYDSRVSGTAINGLSTAGGTAAFLTKFNSDGDKVWTKLLDSSSDDNAYALTTGLDGSIYVSGYTNGSLDGQSNSGNSDTFLTKFSTDGTKVWTLLSGGSFTDYAKTLTTGVDGSIYVSGYTNGSLEGRSLDSPDAFLTKYQDVTSTPTYAINPQYTTANEGSYAYFVFKTENVAVGTIFTYTLSGIDKADISSESLIGTVTANSSGLNTIAIPIKADGIPDANESLTLTIAGKSASVNINDNSPNTWFWQSLKGDKLTSNVIYFNTLYTSPQRSFHLDSDSELISINVDYLPKDIATVYGFESGKDLIHLTNSDVYAKGNSFSGLFSTNNFLSGENLRSPQSANDNVIFDTTTGILYFDIDGIGPAPTNAVFKLADGFQIKPADIQIQQPITYSLTATSPTAILGSSIEFILSTNFYTSTPIPYVISGLASSDVVGGNLSGTVLFGDDKKAIIKVNLSPQLIISNDRTITLTAAEKSATTVFRNSSPTAVTTYDLVSKSSSVNEGSVASFSLTTTGVSPGTSIAYAISGVSSSDVTGGLSGTATVDINGVATISVPIAADFLTEGSETLIVTAQGKSVSIVVNDTSKTTLVASYALSASTNSVYEGSNAVFILTTTNVAGGTSIPYTISGVSSRDLIGGALSGSVVVNSSGTATISIPTLNDGALEGEEKLLINANGAATASISILDTSSALISADTSVVNEGSQVRFTITTKNIVDITNIPFSISGISAEDMEKNAVNAGSLSGQSGQTDGAGVARIWFGITADNITEGDETLKITILGGSSTQVVIKDTSLGQTEVAPPSTVLTSTPFGNGRYYIPTSGADKVTGTAFIDVVRESSNLANNQITRLSDGSWQVQNKLTPSNIDNLVNVERVEFNDMSVALDFSGPAGQVAKILGSVFGQSFVSNVVFAGIGFAYLDGGMSYLDLCGLAAGAAGLSTPDLLVTTLLKNTTGTEPTASSKSSYLQSISSGASYASIVQQIADSSTNAQSIKLTDLANTGLAYTPYVFPPTYSLSASAVSVNEGATAVFNLTTTNVAVGTEVIYTLSGINSSDLISGTLNGKVTVGVGGLVSINVPIALDGATEGQESLTISAQGSTASILINDTSKGSATPTYTLTPATLSVNEGELARVYVNTTNVAAGTVLQYGVSGVSTTDLIGGLTRLVTVDSLGQAFINLQTIADLETEGSETMYITLGTSIASLIINDTSVSIVGVIDGGGGGGDGGGGGGGGGD